MDVLTTVTDWLKTFPLWQGALSVDHLKPVPGSMGLYPQGVQEIARREDVTGNVEVTNRLELLLCRVTGGEDDRLEDARWLLALQQWIGQQSAEGLAPRLGDVPEMTRFRAEQGKLCAPAQTGTGRYAVKISAYYVTKCKMHNA